MTTPRPPKPGKQSLRHIPAAASRDIEQPNTAQIMHILYRTEMRGTKNIRCQRAGSGGTCCCLATCSLNLLACFLSASIPWQLFSPSHSRPDTRARARAGSRRGAVATLPRDERRHRHQPNTLPVPKQSRTASQPSFVAHSRPTKAQPVLTTRKRHIGPERVAPRGPPLLSKPEPAAIPG